MTTDGPSIEHALELIRQGLREADAALDAIPDVAEAFTRASEFAKTAQREVQVTTTNSRGRQAQRIWDEEEMSLAKLAERVNTTPQRLQQLAKRVGGPPVREEQEA